MAKTEYIVLPATQALINEMKGNLRRADREEIYAMSGDNADEALQRGFDSSEMAWIALFDGRPAIAFGAVRYSVLSNMGSAWLVGTDDMRKLHVGVVRKSKHYLGELFKNFDMLENFVDSRNSLSKRWLKWMGFTVEEAKPIGKLGLPFHYFYMRKENYV